MQGDLIDNHFCHKENGSRESLKHTINGIEFFIHCQKKEKYVSKIMSTHCYMEELEIYQTFWMVGGEHIKFKNPEPHSGHNRAKHWVDDCDNRRHDPIDTADMQRTKY